MGWARVAMAATLVAAGIACADPPLDNRIVVGIATSPNQLDPRFGIDEASQRVHQLVYSSLFRLDDALEVVPDLAVGMTTPDERTYIVELRDGVRFHDGRPLGAEDVAFTFASFLDPAVKSPRAGAYRLLEHVRVLDDRHVEFRLKEPFGSFPINLIMGIVPRDRTDPAAPPVGTGPYSFVRFAKDDRVELARFDGYYGQRAANAGVVLRVIPDDTMRGLELRKGSIDLVVNDLTPDIVHELSTEGHVSVSRSPGGDYAYVGLNLRDPLLRRVEVRQALAHAVDRDAIVRHLRRGLGTPAVGILPPMSWAFEPDVPTFAHDPARARRMLDDAGLRDPDGDGPRQRFSLTLKVPMSEFARLQAAVLQQQFAAIGVGVDVRSQELATLIQDVSRGNFQAFALQWVGVTDPDMLRRAFHSSQVPPTGLNRVFFQDAEVDRLIDQATRLVAPERRRALYAAAQRRIASQVPYISLWYKTNVVVAQPDIVGINLPSTAEFAFLAAVHRASGGRRATAGHRPQPARH